MIILLASTYRLGENPFMAYAIEQSNLDLNVDEIPENKVRNEAFYALAMAVIKTIFEDAPQFTI